MKKLLIAYDGSPGADAALADLPRAGLPAELEVLVVTVADVWLPPESEVLPTQFPSTVPPSVQTARARAKAAVANARALAEGTARSLSEQFSGWKTSAYATGDSPAWAVIRQAKSWNADLIVLGSHGRSVLEKLFLGSTAQKVAAEAHCSVRVVRPRQRDAQARLRLMIAVDSSPESDQALQWVARRNWPHETEVRIVTVIDPKVESLAAWPGSGIEQWVRAEDRASDDWVKRFLDHAAQRLANRAVALETEVLRGDPKHQLLRESARWNADCLFLGARGLHHRERLTLGTTASAVAGRASCTVEIVRA